MWPFKKKEVKKEVKKSLIEFIDFVKVLEFKPGDIFVFKTKGCLGDNRGAFVEALKKQMPDGIKGMVLENGMDIEILRKEKE